MYSIAYVYDECLRVCVCVCLWQRLGALLLFSLHATVTAASPCLCCCLRCVVTVLNWKPQTPPSWEPPAPSRRWPARRGRRSSPSLAGGWAAQSPGCRWWRRWSAGPASGPGRLFWGVGRRERRERTPWGATADGRQTNSKLESLSCGPQNTTKSRTPSPLSLRRTKSALWLRLKMDIRDVRV